MLLQVGTKIFIKNKEGKYLVLKRNTGKYKNVKGEWDIVGGRIEAGTTLLENLKREVKAETGLELNSNPALVAAQDIIPENEEKHVVRISYVGEAEGEVKLDDTENTEYKWLSLEEMREMKELDVYVREIIESDSKTCLAAYQKRK